MEKYFVFSLRLEPGIECRTLTDKVYSSICPALNMFYNLVGQYSSALSNCIVESCDTEDSPYLRKVRVSFGCVKIYVYLQKLS